MGDGESGGVGWDRVEGVDRLEADGFDLRGV